MVSPLAVSPRRAATYVRMSTEHQQYSTANQADAIAKYAAQRNLSIVKTFVDHGKSGVKISSRFALLELLREVESGNAAFEIILVYDVSRWGRFQDADESAYYEYVCKRAGVLVHYCAEQFENDGSVSSALLKTIKRSMAGEFSRELSAKVFAGQSRLIELGFRQGGCAGFGFRRQLLDREGRVKGILGHGEEKSIQTDRVKLIPGPDEEISIVRKIFALFTNNFMPEREIVRLLNEQGVPPDRGRTWTRSRVHTLLTSPKYIGVSIYNRKSYKLSGKQVNNPSNMWIRCDHACEPIVPLAQFEQAQQIIRARANHLSDEDLLASLRRLLAKQGSLSSRLIGADGSMPSVALFRKRFKYLTWAYRAIGYQPSRYYRYQALTVSIKQLQQNLCAAVKAKLRSIGATVEDDPKSTFLINGQFTVTVKVCYCSETSVGPRWSVLLDRASLPDITVAARLASGNAGILDYYLIPSLDRLIRRLFLDEDNQYNHEVYRFDSLDFFLTLAQRTSLVKTL
jgi:DNA invertase Pin-like site-specific DNA recombinase